MPFIIPPGPPLVPGSVSPDDEIFAEIFAGEGIVTLAWEQATRCNCYSLDSRQPKWGCPNCGGQGSVYNGPVLIGGLFRSQSRWLSFRAEGELDRGEASLSTPVSIKPGYVDRRVRDRFTVPGAQGDSTEERVFYPAAPAVPFIVGNVQRAWRVQLQSASLAEHLGPQ